MSLNLASQPFVNSRPVRRLVFVLWCLSLLLIGASLFFYASHFSGRQERRGRLTQLTEQEEVERARLAELESELAGFDLEWQNRQVEFLNLRIAERVFPWSRLFDRLTKVMPRDVRLQRLRPEILGLATAGEGGEEQVRLGIRAEARNEEAMLDFVGRLFKHPAFRDPDLASETRPGNSQVTEFELSVIYLPSRGSAAAEDEEAAGGDQPAAAPGGAGGRP